MRDLNAGWVSADVVWVEVGEVVVRHHLVDYHRRLTAGTSADADLKHDIALRFFVSGLPCLEALRMMASEQLRVEVVTI
ncbi:hypothetical protein [Allobranchiibius sp. GilTou38]|uniref:hypothetical protein n=1 Tax=Allobranchiibius sp. GilTou38 TaxID=2815210 RepID=UPI001AA0B679|nr:hypothetical protein [Allobranchiibius sp. GilTou38]MBO1765789.1 hypothetical protein [Allobranchiibius sp. GilTou38]